MKAHPKMNAYMKAADAWMQDYVKTPKVTVILPSGAILTYHESSAELEERRREQAKLLKEIQDDTRAQYPHLFQHG